MTFADRSCFIGACARIVVSSALLTLLSSCSIALDPIERWSKPSKETLGKKVPPTPVPDPEQGE